MVDKNSDVFITVRDLLRALLVTPSAPLRSARPSINRGTVSNIQTSYFSTYYAITFWLAGSF